jgi:peptidyl-prolyl cis-trans isomerase C
MQYRASHILMNNGLEAIKLLERILKKDITFEDAAKQYSVCPTKAVGGDVGEVGPDKFAEPYQTADNLLKAVTLLEVDQVLPAGVLKTQYGFHIIKRTG